MNTEIMIDGQAQAVLIQNKGSVSIVRGSFVFNTTQFVEAFAVELPYTGDGYPVAALIYVKSGVYNTSGTFYKSVWRDTVGVCAIAKNYPSQAPTWAATTANANKASVTIFKKGAMSSPKFEAAKIDNESIFTNESAAAGVPVRFASSTRMSVAVAGDSAQIAFMTGIEYEYVILYSE